MIEVKGLVKTYGNKRAVDGVSFAVNKGDILGFLGPNGAGKSTTMKMITGYLRPDAGTATVAGIDVTQEPVAVKSRIGYLPESDMASAKDCSRSGSVVGQGKIETELKRLGRVGEAAESGLGLKGVLFGADLFARFEVFTDTEAMEPAGDSPRNDPVAVLVAGEVECAVGHVRLPCLVET